MGCSSSTSTKAISSRTVSLVYLICVRSISSFVSNQISLSIESRYYRLRLESWGNSPNQRVSFLRNKTCRDRLVSSHSVWWGLYRPKFQAQCELVGWWDNDEKQSNHTVDDTYLEAPQRCLWGRKFCHLCRAWPKWYQIGQMWRLLLFVHAFVTCRIPWQDQENLPDERSQRCRLLRRYYLYQWWEADGCRWRLLSFWCNN